MLKTIKAVIDSQGNVHLQEPVSLAGKRHALVTILEDESLSSVPETALLRSRPLQRIGTAQRKTQHGPIFNRLESSFRSLLTGKVAACCRACCQPG